MRYFIDKCACFFDFGDADRHFAYHIPLRARRNETLANAMLALAARHRSRTPDVDLYVADRYYHTCLQSLIPRLGDPTATKVDELLAAIVILRLLEEMDGPSQVWRCGPLLTFRSPNRRQRSSKASLRDSSHHHRLSGTICAAAYEAKNKDVVHEQVEEVRK